MGITIGIDASRNRSGGAKVHLLGILKDSDPVAHGIDNVHIWSYGMLLDALPNAPWLIKHRAPQLERSLVHQVWWQYRTLPKEARKYGCDILLNTDAGTVCGYQPAVVMSRDMLSYEPGAIERFGLSAARVRLILLRFMQNRSLRRADGAIFLTRYAANVIQKSCGPLSRIAYIPHGVSNDFKQTSRVDPWPEAREHPIRCIYVSNAAMYKHQWVVVRAIEVLRTRGHDITLTLVGGGAGHAQKLLDEQIASSDPDGVFVEQLDFVPQAELPGHLANADLFVFASSCENMPNTLIEAMAVGLPIACSNRGPMPEVLIDGGVYFDPEDPVSIANAIEQVIQDQTLRSTIAQRAKTLSEQYSWARCANETWAFIVQTYMKTKK